jgi:hypothetical protein
MRTHRSAAAKATNNTTNSKGCLLTHARFRARRASLFCWGVPSPAISALLVVSTFPNTSENPKSHRRANAYQHHGQDYPYAFHTTLLPRPLEQKRGSRRGRIRQSKTDDPHDVDYRGQLRAELPGVTPDARTSVVSSVPPPVTHPARFDPGLESAPILNAELLLPHCSPGDSHRSAGPKKPLTWWAVQWWAVRCANSGHRRPLA